MKDELKNCIKIENTDLTDEERKRNLTQLYDVVNKIASKLPNEVTESWFLTDEELQKMKESGKYRFL